MNKVKFTLNYLGNSVEFEFNDLVSPDTMIATIKRTFKALESIWK